MAWYFVRSTGAHGKRRHDEVFRYQDERRGGGGSRCARQCHQVLAQLAWDGHVRGGPEWREQGQSGETGVAALVTELYVVRE